mgnify:CR=1 FL=1
MSRAFLSFKYFSILAISSALKLAGTLFSVGTDVVLFDSAMVSDVKIAQRDENMKLINTQIYSALGILVFETNKSNINLSSFKIGVYSIKIITDKGVFDRKIIKE